MMQRSKLPPAAAFTLGDKLRILLGALILMLGAAILGRLLPFGITPMPLLVAGAFIGFGVYRLWLGYTRFEEWKREGGKNG